MPVFVPPLSVPKNQRSQYLKNWRLATKRSGRLFLFAGDQKVEHLNDDFFGRGIDQADASPEHLFKIASQSEIGVFATQLGMIARYGDSYRQIPYVVKLNSKTNILEDKSKLLSRRWLNVDQVVRLKNQSRLKIVGVGYTIYLGSEHEGRMLKEAAKIIYDAHQAGLLAILWIYPRHPKVKNEDDIHLIAGAAGVATALGADFVKVKYPYKNKNQVKTATDFREVSLAAGNTGVICVGGSKQAAKDLITSTYLQIKHGQTVGLAIGRNLHQRSLDEAIRLSRALNALIYKNKNDKEALKIFNTPLKTKTRFKSLFSFFSL
ncbi:MAG: aldolase [Patescibacteria group bacterium]